MTPGPSITEGIGNSRVTQNFESAKVDWAEQIPDAPMVKMVYRLLNEEGLFLGSSSGINVCGAVEVAKKMGPGHTIVTILCDGGEKYQSRLFNPEFLNQRGLNVT
jgi:cysteine synthase A